MMRILLLAWAALLLFVAPARAQSASEPGARASFANSCAGLDNETALEVASGARASLTASDALSALCPQHGHLAPLFQSAADRYRIHAVVLVAMARVESTCDPRAVNARTRSYGILQIKLDGSANVTNATPDELLAPETSIDLGARHLRRWWNRCGSLAGALAVFHGKRRCDEGKRDAYAKRVIELVEWAKRKIQRLKEKRA